MLGESHGPFGCVGSPTARKPSPLRAISRCVRSLANYEPTLSNFDKQAHQNTSHAEEIDAFNAKLAAVKDESMISDDDKEMAKYLSEVHNLANKGIKGRGKGRKVKRVMMLHPPQHQSSLSTSPISTASHASAHIQPDYSGLPYYDLGWLSEHI